MILIIDTTDRVKIKLGLVEENTEWFEFETQDQSADLLINLEKVLKEQNLKLKDLKAIFVNCGSGSFTGVRVGVTVANTLSWSFDIPSLGYKDGQFKMALDKFKNLKNKEFSKITLPYYQ